MWDKEWVCEKVEHTNVEKMHSHPHGEDYRCIGYFLRMVESPPIGSNAFIVRCSRGEHAEVRST